jgi:hypothetical protein
MARQLASIDDLFRAAAKDQRTGNAHSRAEKTLARSRRLESERELRER